MEGPPSFPTCGQVVNLTADHKPQVQNPPVASQVKVSLPLLPLGDQPLAESACW